MFREVLILPESSGLRIEVSARALRDPMDTRLWNSLGLKERAAFDGISDPEHRVAWCEARRCLQELAVKSANSLSSLAHSRWRDSGIAVAAAAYPASPSNEFSISGVGVDTEHEDRAVSAEVKAWLTGKDPQAAALDPLSVWMIKEACFKADPEQTSKTTLADYRIESIDGVDSRRGSVRSSTGDIRFAFHLMESAPWKFAIAYAMATPK